MRIFANPIEAVKETERDLYEMGIEVQSHTVQDQNVDNDLNYMSLELMGHNYTITAWTENDLEEMVKYLHGNIEWCNAEFVERITACLVPVCCINPGKAWNLRKDIWYQYLHDGRFAYTYNERYNDQLHRIISELKIRPNTRQAVLTVYDKHDDSKSVGGYARVPCSMYYHFMIRNGTLNCIYYQRSCDFLKHFVHDVYLTIRLQEHIASAIGIPTGYFIHNIGSLHAFKKDLNKRGVF